MEDHQSQENPERVVHHYKISSCLNLKKSFICYTLFNNAYYNTDNKLTKMPFRLSVSPSSKTAHDRKISSTLGFPG